MTYEQGAELLNFGAFTAFIGVNVAALVHYTFRSRERVAFPFLIPALGAAVCTFMWWNLGMNSKILGAVWLCVGVIVAWGMRRMRRKQAAGQAFGA